MPVPPDRTPDALAMTLKAMYDLYADCAGGFFDLIDWLQREKPKK